MNRDIDDGESVLFVGSLGLCAALVFVAAGAGYSYWAITGIALGSYLSGAFLGMLINRYL